MNRILFFDLIIVADKMVVHVYTWYTQ